MSLSISNYLLCSIVGSSLMGLALFINNCHLLNIYNTIVIKIASAFLFIGMGILTVGIYYELQYN